MAIVDITNYAVDDSNEECGYILVLDCSLGNFVFKSPCDIIRECDLDLNDLINWETFDRCKMVTHSHLNGMNPGYLIRVNQSGDCIEGVDPNSLSRLHDYRVRVTSGDTEDYLQNKVVGTPGRVNVTLVGGSNQKLQIDVDESGLNGLLPANPGCDKATLMYDTVHGPYWECEENRGDSYRAQRYLTTDFIGDSTADPVNRPVNPNPGDLAIYNYVQMDGFEGNSNMNFTINAASYSPSNFVSGCTWMVPGIKIIKTGLYQVRANSDVTVGPMSVGNGIANIRLFVYTNNQKTIIVNMKEGIDTTGLIPEPGQGFTDNPNAINFNLSGNNFVYLKEGEWLMLGVRVDRMPNSEEYAFTLHKQAYSLQAPYASSQAGNLSGTTFGCRLVSTAVMNAS